MSAKCSQTAVRWLVIAASILSLCPFSLDELGAEEVKDVCEVVGFDAFEESQAVLTPSGDYKVIARRQCANLTVRNISGSSRLVGDFVVIAVFGTGNISEGGLDLGSDDMKKRILPGETYSGAACLDDSSPILIMNCAVK